jgi:hypothetical protein
VEHFEADIGAYRPTIGRWFFLYSSLAYTTDSRSMVHGR